MLFKNPKLIVTITIFFVRYYFVFKLRQMNTDTLDFSDFDEQSQKELQGMKFLSIDDMKEESLKNNPLHDLKTLKPIREIFNEIALETPNGKNSALYKSIFTSKNIDFQKIIGFLEEKSSFIYNQEKLTTRATFIGNKKLQLKAKLYKESGVVDIHNSLELKFDYLRKNIEYLVHYYFVDKEKVEEKNNKDHIAFTVSSSSFNDFESFLKFAKNEPSKEFLEKVTNSFLNAFEKIIPIEDKSISKSIDLKQLNLAKIDLLVWLYRNTPDFIKEKYNLKNTPSLDRISIENKLKISSVQDKDSFDSINRLEVNSKDFPTAYWSSDYDGKLPVDSSSYEKYRSNLEKTVYFQLNVNQAVPTNTEIEFKLLDNDKISYPLGFVHPFFTFYNLVTTDDDKFDDKEIKILGIVREFEGKKRITLELFLNPSWANDIIDDKSGPSLNGSLELYWSWQYNNIDWTSKKVQLYVYPSDISLRLKAAYFNGENNLPEMYSHTGDIITFALDRLPDGTIKKFVSIKIRNTITYKSFEDVNQFYKEIYTERINLVKNKIEASTYEIVELNHYFKIKNDATQIFIEEENIIVPVEKGTKTAAYNSFYTGVKVIKEATKYYGYFSIFKDTINMFPELSGNDEFNVPSLSTFVGLIPGLDVIAFGLALTEWTMKDQIAEQDKLINESLFLKWQNIKKQGLEAALNFIDFNGWAISKKFQAVFVCQETLDKLFKGNFKTIDELRDFNNMQNKENKCVLISYRINNEDLGTFDDVIDCIFLKS